MTSRTVTVCPSSSKHAPVTRPTYPAPKTAIRFPWSLMLARTIVAPAAALRLADLRERLQALRDRDHRLVREAVEERVDDPVRRAVGLEHHHVQARAVVVELVAAATDLPHEVAAGEHGRILPVGHLDAPVLVAAEPVRQTDRAVLLLRV